MNAPFNNINGSLVNVDGSNYSGSSFTSKVIPSTVNPAALPEPLSNIQAANSFIPCASKGGKRVNNRKTNNKRKIKKIKNISNMYKMNMSKRSMKRKSMKNKSMKRKSMKRKSMKKKGKRTMRRSRKSQKGGYAQYQNNLPMTGSYSLGAPLPNHLSALANPPPYHQLPNCYNCSDNYSHYQNVSSPSKGW